MGRTKKVAENLLDVNKKSTRSKKKEQAVLTVEFQLDSGLSEKIKKTRTRKKKETVEVPVSTPVSVAGDVEVKEKKPRKSRISESAYEVKIDETQIVLADDFKMDEQLPAFHIQGVNTKVSIDVKLDKTIYRKDVDVFAQENQYQLVMSDINKQFYQNEVQKIRNQANKQ